MGVLGVHDQQPVEGRDLAHDRLELSRVQWRELVDAGVQQEALESEDAGVVQRAQLGEVARNRAAPEADVDVRLGRGGLSLEVQGRYVASRRDAVERHVDDRGDAAGRGRFGRAGEALPLGAPWVVHVNVRIDEAGHQHLVVGQRHLVRAVELGVVRRDGNDLPVTHPNSPRHLAAGGNYPACSDHEVQHTHPRPRFAPGADEARGGLCLMMNSLRSFM
jgi:hypothetical protein